MQTNPLHNLIVLAAGLLATIVGIVYVACSKPHRYWLPRSRIAVQALRILTESPTGHGGLDNVIRMGPQLYSGSEPHG